MAGVRSVKGRRTCKHKLQPHTHARSHTPTHAHPPARTHTHTHIHAHHSTLPRAYNVRRPSNASAPPTRGVRSGILTRPLARYPPLRTPHPCHTWSAPGYQRCASTVREASSTPCTSTSRPPRSPRLPVHHRFDRLAALPRFFCRRRFFAGAGTAVSAAAASLPWAPGPAGCAPPVTRARLRTSACFEGRLARGPSARPTPARSAAVGQRSLSPVELSRRVRRATMYM